MLPKTTSVEVVIEHKQEVVREEPVVVEEQVDDEPRRRVRKAPVGFPDAAYRQAPQRWW